MSGRLRIGTFAKLIATSAGQAKGQLANRPVT